MKVSVVKKLLVTSLVATMVLAPCTAFADGSGGSTNTEEKTKDSISESAQNTEEEKGSTTPPKPSGTITKTHTATPEAPKYYPTAEEPEPAPKNYEPTSEVAGAKLQIARGSPASAAIL